MTHPTVPRRRRFARRVVLAALTAVVAFAPLAGFQDPAPPVSARELGLARDVLPGGDGWASLPVPSLPNGTTGGAGAAPDRIVVVTTRRQLVTALAYPDATPKIVFIRGTIDANVDDSGTPRGCDDYVRPDPTSGERYSTGAYLAAFDPAGPWGRANPSGPLERSRVASAAAQAARVRIRVPANTTIYGLGRSATLRGAWLDISPDVTTGHQPMNVIVRNLTFEDTADCFPAWSPADGPTGNWNSNYDAVSIRRATHVWIDHNRFLDRTTADDTQPTYFGHVYQVHDGLLDITNEADLVTVTWNQFQRHDKTMLIGGSDGAVADRGTLRVTLHHNLFDGVGQRAPRVRFGRVHAYNNLYRAGRGTPYVYSWGVGVESQLVAENNYLEIEPPHALSAVVMRYGGTRLTAVGNCVATARGCEPVDVVSAWNARSDPDLTDADWTPTLYGGLAAAPATGVRDVVIAGSGPRD